MDERIKFLWLTRYPPRTLREYIIETGMRTYPLNIHVEEE